VLLEIQTAVAPSPKQLRAGGIRRNTKRSMHATASAEIYLVRLRSQVDWLAPALHVYPKYGLVRVHAGPYTSRADTQGAADRISQARGFKPMVLTRQNQRTAMGADFHSYAVPPAGACVQKT
jgi:hypothetical protein